MTIKPTKLIISSGLALLVWMVIGDTHTAFTPEQAMRQQQWTECSPDFADCVEPLGTCMAEPGHAVVVYRVLRAIEGGKPQVFGIRNVKRKGLDWQVTGGVSTRQLPPSPKHLIEYQYLSDGTRSSFCPMIYGRVLTSAKVTAVEATFNNGQTLRYKTTDGVFALISSKDADSAHYLRVLGVDGQVLEDVDLSQPQP